MSLESAPNHDIAKQFARGLRDQQPSYYCPECHEQKKTQTILWKHIDDAHQNISREYPGWAQRREAQKQWLSKSVRLIPSLPSHPNRLHSWSTYLCETPTNPQPTPSSPPGRTPPQDFFSCVSGKAKADNYVKGRT